MGMGELLLFLIKEMQRGKTARKAQREGKAPATLADDFAHEEEAVFRVIRIFGLWGGPDDTVIEGEETPVAKARLRAVQVAQRLA
jgi:hypothetical protein